MLSVQWHEGSGGRGTLSFYWFLCRVLFRFVFFFYLCRKRLQGLYKESFFQCFSSIPFSLKDFLVFRTKIGSQKKQSVNQRKRKDSNDEEDEDDYQPAVLDQRLCFSFLSLCLSIGFKFQPFAAEKNKEEI